MKALVLTFDAQLEVANLVIESYRQLWPDCPFTFRVPYTERDAKAILRSESKLELVQTAIDIRSSMEGLLRGIDDSEFVFWCIDDRYPISIDDLAAVESIYRFVLEEAEGVTAIRLSALRPGARASFQADLLQPALEINGIAFHQQTRTVEHGFYMPQFARAGWLRRFFLADSLPAIYRIRDFHELLKQSSLNARIYFPERSFISLGESTMAGALTSDCLARFHALGQTPPDLPVVESNRTYD